MAQNISHGPHDEPAPPEVEGEYLQGNRALILQRSLLGGLMGIIPLPLLDDALAQWLRRNLLSRIAERRHVDLDDAALSVLCAETQAQERKNLFTVLSSSIPVLRPRRWTRGLFLGVLLVGRLDETLRLFQLATLFDHYCARHHLGAAIDEAQALKLRLAIDEVTRRTQRETVGLAFDKALSTVAQALLSLPGLVVRGVSSLRGRRDPALSADADKEGPAKVRTTFLKRAVPLVQAQTQALMRSAGLRPYVSRLVQNFERRWTRKQSER